MNIMKLSIKPCNHGYDPNLMVACITQVAKFNPGADIDTIAHAAVAMYCKVADLVAANGGQIEVPAVKSANAIVQKEGTC